MLGVFGALAGARSLNELAVESFGARGPGRPPRHRRARLRVGAVARDPRTTTGVLPTTEHFGAALSAADLALSRAGGTVWELAAAGTPAVLVPYPFATGDHQTKNARYFASGGGAIVVPETSSASPRTSSARCVDDEDRLAQMSRGDAEARAARRGRARSRRS